MYAYLTSDVLMTFRRHPIFLLTIIKLLFQKGSGNNEMWFIYMESKVNEIQH